MTKLDIDLAEAARFLTLFSEDSNAFTFQTFTDAKGPPTQTLTTRKSAWHRTGTFEELKGQLVAANLGGSGVYFMVNHGDGHGREIGNVTGVRALFADLDGAPISPVYEAPLEPHAIVESSPGKFQVFYLIDGCPLERFAAVQKALARKFCSDGSVSDLPRVMRIPGFYHQKKECFRSKLLSLAPGLPYKLGQFLAEMQLCDLEVEEAEKLAAPLPKIDTIPLGSISEGDRHAFLMKNAVKYAAANYSELEVLVRVQGLNHTLCSTPKPFDEVRSLVEYAISYTGPRVDLSELLANSTSSPTKAPIASSSAGLISGESSLALALPVALVTSAPGLTGLMAEWVAANVARYQPHFALAATLAFIGALKGHRVQTARRYRTNHMTIGIGRSGSGKSEVGNRIDDIIRMGEFEGLACGIPSSDAAVRTTLAKHNGRTYLFWDEMGLALENMLGRNAPVHMKSIKDILIEVSTKAYGMLRKKERAIEDKDSKYENVDQPCLGMYGTAQPDVFYGALSSSHASDGFYPRLLVFETADNYPVERELVYTPPPEELLDACRQIEAWPTNVNCQGNLDNRILPRTVPFSAEARRVYDLVKKDVERKLSSSNEASSGIWARTMGHVEKIALTVEDQGEITKSSMEWASEVMLYLSPAMAGAFLMRVSDSAIEAEKKRVLGHIIHAGPDGIQQNVLTRLTQFIKNGRERESLLKELMEAGEIEYQDVQSEKGGRTVRVWRIPSNVKRHQTSTNVNDAEKPVLLNPSS